jgi:uroporphyrinogen-III synthase
MSLHVAITRAAPENAHTAARLQALGAIPLLAPLLDIETRAFDANLTGVQALLFTSSNGARALASQSDVRNVPVFAVGDATAQSARDLGFAEVQSANGDVASLAALATTALDPRAGKLLHIGGAHIAGDLSGALVKAGFTVERRVAYEAKAAVALPEAFSERLDVVLFHSARAANALVQLRPAGAEKMTAACISPAVAEAVSALPWRRLLVAPAPREDVFLKAALGA